MNRAAAPLLLGLLLAWNAGGPLRATPLPPPPQASLSGTDDTNIEIDPAIARASAEADANAGQAAAAAPSGPQTPYQRALLNYKSGKYAAARMLIDQADQDQPGNAAVEMLKVRILAELDDFTGAHEVLNSLYDRTDLSPAYAAALQLTTGDLNLRQHKFDAASKAYLGYLDAHPNDPDGMLRLIYARLGVGDLVTAGKLASELKPSDPATPAYYFAHAALAHSGIGTEDEDQDIQQARTIYGITLTNRYLKTYLEVFNDKSGGGGAASPAPSGKVQ